MKKLTKQQADWLMQMLDMYHIHTDCSLICEACEIKYGEVKNVIKGCTEQPFPDFEMPIKINRNVCIGNIALAEHTSGVLVDTPEDDFVLSPTEFKHFTEACVKIDEWLEGKK